jgi:hypothetical protein
MNGEYDNGIVDVTETKEYKEGVEFFNSDPDFKLAPNPTTEIHKKHYDKQMTYSDSDICKRSYFNIGFDNAKIAYWHNFYNTSLIQQEINEVLKRHNATISFGCGCCGGGININGFEFMF